jgi:hypothetical protein
MTDMNLFKQYLEDLRQDPSLSKEEKAELILFFLWPNVSKENITPMLSNLKLASSIEKECIVCIRESFEDTFIINFYLKLGDKGLGASSVH